jgi:hypothetical protein
MIEFSRKSRSKPSNGHRLPVPKGMSDAFIAQHPKKP